ncbi:uncharacterized protein LOC130903591 [Diorhabda carinulata]|uniref:uncharacterized protein LOC130903591 n=1 Tax=Diorhabda carinulata TaxID=1163345 RepID=UPI0025A2BF16|nr:uncharacterized protein LOC130903591 [Diorhabda carinulata]
MAEYGGDDSSEDNIFIAELSPSKGAIDVLDVSHIEKNKISHPKSIAHKFKSLVKVKKKISKPEKYFTDGRNVTEANITDLDKTKPYKYPTSYEELGHKIMTRAWRKGVVKEDLQVPIHKKQGLKEKLNNDLFNRLYVKVPPDSTKTILDLDPQYFKVVEGRPIHESFNRRDYIETVRDVLRTKILIGYREDDIALINQNLANEQKMIQQIQENYQMYVNAFEDLLFRDHLSAKQLLGESDAIANEAYDKYEEYKRLAKKYGAMKAALYSSEEKWANCRMYQKFLYKISPLQWRNEHSIKAIDENEMDDHLTELRASLVEKDTSLSEIIDFIKIECANEPPPELYFTDTDQLIDVFRFMEVQNLNYLLHAEELAIPLANIKDGMRFANQLFDVQINDLEQSISDLASGIEWEENRAKELENLAQTLISNDFKKLIMSEEILNLHVFVEDVYETRIGPNDANNSMLEMMKQIEQKYRYEVLSFDMVPAEQVALLEGTCYNEQMKIMKLAEKAAKQYAELNTLTKQLNKAYAPPFKRGLGKEPKNRSQVIDPPVKVEPPPRDLTEEEEEYLEYFTDFCKYTDDPTKYGIDRSRSGKTTIPSHVVDDEKVSVRTPGRAKYVTRIHGIEFLEKIIMTNT